MSQIDLEYLSKRESERVEWKENVADIEDIVKTAVAFANDYSNLGGGYIVCGATETKDEYGFQKIVLKGLDSTRFKEIEGKTTALLRERVSPALVPVIEEIQVDSERRILVFIIAASDKAHSFRNLRTGETVYYIRIGRQTREARNGLMMELFRSKGVMPPWDKQVNKSASLKDIDLITLRSYLQVMELWDSSKSIDDYLSSTRAISAHIPPLLGREGITQNEYPRNFSLLLFAEEPLVFFKGAYAYLSIYNGTDRSEPYGVRHEINGNIVAQTRKLIDLLSYETATIFKKENPMPNLTRYPKRAIQEAVVNCMVHRDYEIEQPIRITIFNDRIEFFSPGKISGQINKSQFRKGKAAPFWRNQTLAYFFNKMQLAQAEGQGIPTIISLLSEAGCPAPKFEFGKESFTIIIYPNSSI